VVFVVLVVMVLLSILVMTVSVSMIGHCSWCDCDGVVGAFGCGNDVVVVVVGGGVVLVTVLPLLASRW